jgi:hypothetical protein
VVAVFPVPGEPSAPVKPCDGSLDDPALGFNDEALGVFTTFDDFDRQAVHYLSSTSLEDRSCIGAVGEQLAQEGELSEQSGQQQDAAVTVLNVGGRHQRVQYQTQRIDENMALLAFDQLAGIEPMRVDNKAPFSALFTLWLSITQAVGLISRSACSRHLT